MIQESPALCMGSVNRGILESEDEYDLVVSTATSLPFNYKWDTLWYKPYGKAATISKDRIVYIQKID